MMMEVLYRYRLFELHDTKTIGLRMTTRIAGLAHQ